MWRPEEPGMGMEQTGMGMEQTEMGMEQTGMGMKQTGVEMEQTGVGMDQTDIYLFFQACTTVRSRQPVLVEFVPLDPEDIS